MSGVRTFSSALLARAKVFASSISSRSFRVWLAVAILIGLVVFASAFLRHARRVNAQEITAWTEDVTADCAVALTGGPNRIREGLDLLSRKSVRKLIISGVNPQAELREIVPLWPYYGDLRDQDVILERRSRTTFGNAQQTLPLVDVLQCRDLVLITSRVHMYRALRTFKAEFPPDFPIIPRAVVSGSVRAGWWELLLETTKSMFYALWAY